MLKVNYDWTSSKFEAAAGIILGASSLVGGSNNTVAQSAASSASSSKANASNKSVISMNGGVGFSGPPGSIGMDEEVRSNMASFGGVGSAFSSTANQPNSNQICCLTEDSNRCNRIAGNASYSKRIQKTVQQKRLRLSIDNTARHIYICDHHKSKSVCVVPLC